MAEYARAADGVRIAYEAAGTGSPALVFIHGGLADRSFWSSQLRFFSAGAEAIALDLAGHGESGLDRSDWSIRAFGSDVCAVLRARNVSRAVLIGNSLGGPVAVEAALLDPDRVAGVVGVDTFHAFDYKIEASEAHQRAEAFRGDYAGSLHGMVQALFHKDADPAVMNDAERRMSRTQAATAWGMFHAFAGYDLEASVRRLPVPLPIRCINGDLYPVNMEQNRRVHPDFDAVILPHTGHYPMLECPEAFNRRLSEIVASLA